MLMNNLANLVMPYHVTTANNYFSEEFFIGIVSV